MRGDLLGVSEGEQLSKKSVSNAGHGEAEEKHCSSQKSAEDEEGIGDDHEEGTRGAADDEEDA